MMWQVGVTILIAETLHNIKFRHQQRISNSDILLVHCSGQHYVAAGEPSLFLIDPVQCIYFGTPVGVNGMPVGLYGTPVVLLACGLIAPCLILLKIVHFMYWHSSGVLVGRLGMLVSHTLVSAYHLILVHLSF